MLDKLSIQTQGYSERLQRKVVYAGQATGFDTAVASLKELSDLEINKTAIRRISLKHGKEAGEYLNGIEVTDAKAEYIMSQTDGSMVPITSTNDSDLITPSQDKRKNKKRIFKEIRLNYAKNNRGQSYYNADFVYANDIKPFIYDSLTKTGYSKGNTKLYAIGDGAPWIYNTYYGIDTSVNYTIDYYHLEEKLADVAPSIIEKTKWSDINVLREKSWTKALGKKIINGGIEAVYQQMCNHEKSYLFYDVTTYISNRPNQFNYPLLESLDLPIGSGIVEGGHKSIIQKRLIKSGSGWKTDNAKNIVNLRLLNANNQWNEYWDYQNTKHKLCA